MTRTLMLVASLAAIGCGREHTDDGLPDYSRLYSIENGQPVCPGAEVFDFPDWNPPQIVCVWSCVTLGGREFRTFGVAFEPDGTGGWRKAYPSWEDGACP